MDYFVKVFYRMDHYVVLQRLVGTIITSPGNCKPKVPNRIESKSPPRRISIAIGLFIIAVDYGRPAIIPSLA